MARRLAESPYARQKFMANLDATSAEEFRQSAEGYRQVFYDEVIGRFDEPLLPANPRSRVRYDQPKWTGYGQGTFHFLHQHLDWPVASAAPPGQGP